MSEARWDPAEASAAPAGSGDAPEVHDDDELAAAIQAQLERFAPSGAIPGISEQEAQAARRAPATAPTRGPPPGAAAPPPRPAPPPASPPLLGARRRACGAGSRLVCASGPGTRRPRVLCAER